MMPPSMMKALHDIIILLPAFLLVFTVHGFARALIAKWMGDDTPQQDGFLSLNPLVHVNLFGILSTLLILFFLSAMLPETGSRSLLIIMLILLGVRWTNRVVIDDRNFKQPLLGVVMTSLAGALGNFSLVLICFYILAYFPFASFSRAAMISLVEVFNAIIEFALFFGVLDLIPLPPFECGRILKYLLPDSFQRFVSILEDYSLIVLLLLLVVPGTSDLFFGGISMLVALVGKGLSLLVF